MKVEADGYDLGAQRREIERNDLPEALRMVKAFQADPEGEPANPSLAQTVCKNQLGKDGEYNFSAERYKILLLRDHKWPMVPIGDVCEIQSGFGFPVSFQGDLTKEIPFLKVSDMNMIGNEIYIRNWNNTVSKDDLIKLHAKSAPPGTIIFPKIGAAIATNKKRILSITSTFDNNVMGLIPSDRINSTYLFYLLKNIDISTWASDSSLPSMKKSFVEKVKIPLPPIEEQQAIVDEIDGYQKIIDGARQVVENYKPLIKIDPSWPLARLGEVITLEYGKPLKEENRIPGKYPVFGSNGIVGYHTSYLVEGPFIIVGRKGSAGEVVYSDENGFPIDTTFFVKIKENNRVDLKFLYYQLIHLELGKVNVQSGVPGLNRNDAYLKLIALPTLEEQKRIVNKIQFEEMLIKSNNELITLFKTKIEEKIQEVWGD